MMPVVWLTGVEKRAAETAGPHSVVSEIASRGTHSPTAWAMTLALYGTVFDRIPSYTFAKPSCLIASVTVGTAAASTRMYWNLICSVVVGTVDPIALRTLSLSRFISTYLR